jgi:hypothetical protein
MCPSYSKFEEKKDFLFHFCCSFLLNRCKEERNMTSCHSISSLSCPAAATIVVLDGDSLSEVGSCFLFSRSSLNSSFFERGNETLVKDLKKEAGKEEEEEGMNEHVVRATDTRLYAKHYEPEKKELQPKKGKYTHSQSLNFCRSMDSVMLGRLLLQKGLQTQLANLFFH